jgi:hypothetical protein
MRARPLLLCGSAALLALGGVMHTRAFGKAAAAAASSSLPPFYGSSFQALWLIDSATLLVLAAIFALLAARPAHASGAAIVLLSLIPGATAFLLYRFMGSFLPAHLLLTASLMGRARGYGGRRFRRSMRPREVG